VKDHFRSRFPKAGAKVLLFFELTKFFGKKMKKKCICTLFTPIQGRQPPMWRALKRASVCLTNCPHDSIYTIDAIPRQERIVMARDDQGR